MSLPTLATGFHLDQTPTQSRTTLARALRFVRPYRTKLALYALLLVVAAAAGALPPLAFRAVLDEAIPAQDLSRVNILIAAAVGCYLVSAGLMLAGGYLGTLIGTAVIRDLRQELFDHIQRLPLNYFVRVKTGELQSRLNTDVVNAQQIFTGQMFSGNVGSVAANVMTLAFTISAMFVLDWRIALATLLLTPVMIIAVQRAAPRYRRLVREQMELYGQMNAHTAERFNVAGVLLVRLFGKPGQESRLFATRINALRRNNIGVNTLALIVGAGVSLAGFIGVATVYWTGGVLAILGGVTAGTIVALAAYIQRAYTPLVDLASTRMNIQAALVSFDRVFEVLDTPAAVQEPDTAQAKIINGDIDIRNLWFRHLDEPSDRWALQEINLHLPSGTTTALVGPSGAGKTTLCMLVARLYDPTRGAVLIDNTDLRSYTLNSLTQQIAVVTQDAHFFHESIRDNLLYAKPDATDAELIDACKAAQIHDLITDLSDRYDTIVGDRGHRFSGGEKQRLALARAMLRDPRIVILDEATAHLDTRTEALIQQALKTVLAGRTSLVIAHRLTTIRDADQIVVLDRGCTAGTGTHHDLLNNPLYVELLRGVSVPRQNQRN